MNDAKWLRAALRLARRGMGRTAPNPPVGALVVAAEGTIVGRGFHQRAGAPHAEALALAEAGTRARGATLYCTLEPCCHYGRTPPCTEAILRAGIRRVVYGLTDPDPRCAGGGAAQLREAGVLVEQLPPSRELIELYEAYVKHKTTGRPFVTLKLALTLDGKAATAHREARWITSEKARALVHRWRNEADAILVGVGTVLADDPQLTVRPEPPDGRQPLRVIADSAARTPPQARVLCAPGRCVIAVTTQASAARVAALERAGAEIVALETGPDEHLRLEALLDYLGAQNVMSVLCEGGPALAAGLMRAGLVDKFQLFYAPKIFGAEGYDGIGPLGFATLDEAVRLDGDTIRCRRVGPDLLVTAYPYVHGTD